MVMGFERLLEGFEGQKSPNRLLRTRTWLMIGSSGGPGNSHIPAQTKKAVSTDLQTLLAELAKSTSIAIV